MKLYNVINLFQEINDSKGILSCKISLGLKSEILDLAQDLKKKIDLFDKEQLEFCQKEGIKLIDNILSDDNPKELLDKFLIEREKILNEDIPFDISKYQIPSEKISELEIEHTPFLFIKIFIKKDYTDI